MKSPAELSSTIENILRPHFPTDTIYATPSPIDPNVRVLVVSKTFDRLDEDKKIDKLWSILHEQLPAEDQARVSLLLPLSPSELI